MKLAFCIHSLELPPKVGAHIRCSQMMLALRDAGHDVRLFHESGEGLERLGLPFTRLGASVDSDGAAPQWPGRGLKAWYAKYRGVSEPLVNELRGHLVGQGFDAVVYVGVQGLLFFEHLKEWPRIWYIADDMFLHYMTALRHSRQAGFGARLKDALIESGYEFLFRNDLDRAWVVSNEDQRWMQRVMRHDRIDNIPNGVDIDFFAPVDVEQQPHRIAFWGNLYFGPNVEALDWFIPEVWEPLHRQMPQSEFLVIGREPTDAVRSLLKRPGIVFRENLPDLRPAVCSAPIAVFPLRTGSGIKNKLLEGAAMQRALVASPRATAGLAAPNGSMPWLLCDTAAQWQEGIHALWADPNRVSSLAASARHWIVGNYRWGRAAHQAEESIRLAIERARQRAS